MRPKKDVLILYPSSVKACRECTIEIGAKNQGCFVSLEELLFLHLGNSDIFVNGHAFRQILI